MLNILSFVVAVIGVTGVLFSLRQAYRARLRQFEERYVERYWSILDSLSLAALSIAKLSPDRDDELAIRKYIFLCEDELQMRKNGYISDSTYYEWADGMLDQFRQPMFAEVWNQVRSKAGEHKEGAFAYENLKSLLDSVAGKENWIRDDLKRADPLRSYTVVRAIRGLKGITGVLGRRQTGQAQRPVLLRSAVSTSSHHQGGEMPHKAVPGICFRFGRGLQPVQMLVDLSGGLHQQRAPEPPIAAPIPATGF
jgi:hypothetical protein